MGASSAGDAIDWLHTVLDEPDFAEAWIAMHEDLRLAMAQEWLWARRGVGSFVIVDLPQWAEALAVPGWGHPARRAFFEDTQRALRAHLAAYDRTAWRADPGEATAVDEELVVIRPLAGDPAEPVKLLLRHVKAARWEVSGLDGKRPQPGWPRDDM